MSTERRHHFEWNKIKKSIVEYVLNADDSVNEPVISGFLLGKYGEFNISTVNKHLHSLVKLGCFESTTKTGKGKQIFYDIKTVENLKSIKNEFEGIQLKKFTKAKNIIIAEKFPTFEPTQREEYFIFMSLSASLFDTFLDNDFEEMFNRASEIWKTEDYNRTINRLTDQVYERLFLYQTDSNRFLDPFSNEFSKDEFKKLLEELPFPLEEPHDKSEKTIIKLFVEKLKHAVNTKKNECSKEVFQGLVKRLRGDIEGNVYKIKYYQNAQRENISERLVEHFYERDVLNGTADITEEKKFVTELKEHVKKINSPEIQAGIKDYRLFIDKWYEYCKNVKSE